MIERLPEYLSSRPNVERYKNFMDASLADKAMRTLPYLDKYAEQDFNPTFLSIGAGTGNLERVIAGAIPNSSVIGLDTSLPMLESIKNGSAHNALKDVGMLDKELLPLCADAGNLPIRENTIDAVIASSIVHEIASYKNDFQLGESVEGFYMDVARVLKDGGRLVIRDFMQPKNPEEVLLVRMGTAIQKNDADPRFFTENFVKDFKGDDLNYVRRQIQELKVASSWRDKAVLKMKASHAFELAVHYSWAQSYDQEVKEKYAYLPVGDYAQFVLDAFQKAGTEGVVVDSYTYLQEGYPQHVNGRLDFKKRNGEAYPFPDVTGVIVIEKVED